MTTMIVPFYKYLNNKVKSVTNTVGITENKNLHFSSYDEVGENVLALDIRKRKLLYLRKRPEVQSCLIIDLNDVDRCAIKQQYNSIDAGALPKRKITSFLKSIFLQLGFKNGNTVSLPIYDAKRDDIKGIEQLEAKARKWRATISKLLPRQLTENNVKHSALASTFSL